MYHTNDAAKRQGTNSNRKQNIKAIKQFKEIKKYFSH